MRIKCINPIELTIQKLAIFPPIFFLIIAFLVFLFSQSVAWAAPPPTPTNLTATTASSHQINLSWIDNATTETNYYVERSQNGSKSWTIIAHLGANITSYQDAVLTQNATYYYRVRCKAGKTYSRYSNTANAKTATLAAPTALSATVASVSSISLALTDNTTYESNYSVERSPNGSKSWTVIAILGANVTTYTNAGLSVGTAYYYRVRAYDGTNYSAYSSVVSQTIRTIAASAGANGAISPNGTVGAANGTMQVFSMTPNAGYKIASVNVDGSAVATNSTYTFSNITANHTISATFSGNTFTIAASAGANGSISPSGSEAVNGGANHNYTITPNTNYHVNDVLVDGVSVGAVTSYTFTNVTAPHTIAASFAVNTYTITATVGANGTITPSGAVSIDSGATQIFTMTPNSGYYLSNLSVDGSSVATASTYTFTNVFANHTIAATYSAITYTITASAGANGIISPAGEYIVSSGGTATFTITPAANYHVADVVVDGASMDVISSFTFTDIIANHIISASFAINTFTVTPSITGGSGTINPSAQQIVSYGSNTTFTITPNTGYYLSNLSVDGSSVATASTYTFTNVTANHTIAATYSAITYTITASAGANGTISPLGAVSVISGATQTFTMTPTTGYRVSDVQVDGSSVGVVSSYPFSNVISNHTITAIFSAASTTISGGTIAANTTWTLANSPYVVTGDVTIGSSSNPVLTIEAGVVVKFNSGTGLNIAGGWSIQGSLNAVGTAEAPIIFTSNDPAPAPGKWKGITFNNGTNTTLLDHVTVEFGGSNGIGNLYIYSGSPTIRNSTIWKSSTFGIYAGNSYNAPTIQNSTISNNTNHGIYVYSSATPTITGNTITNNRGYGIYDATGTAALISANTISGSGSYPARMGVLQTGNVNTYGTNGINAVEVIGGTIGQNLTMKNLGLPYIITSDITTGSSSSPVLTIEAGMVVKFNNGTGLNIANGWSVPGALNAVGTAAAPILFTSNDPAPVPGKWKGITFNNGTTTASLDYVTVEFGGSNGIGNLYIYSGSPSITNSTIRQSSNYGINVASSYASPIIQNNTITNNGGYGIYDASGTATLISGNTISASGSYPARMAVLQTGNVNTFGTNGINAVEVFGGTIGQNLTMKNNGIPYIVLSGIIVNGSSTPMLTIEPGSTLKFAPGTGLQIGDGTTSGKGTLSARGLPTSKILFTSKQAVPIAGNWNGISLTSAGTSASDIEQAIIEYGGQGGVYYNANLVLNQSSPVIANCSIRNSAGSGVYVTNASNYPVIVNSDITSNKWGVYALSSNPYVMYNNIYSNTTAGVWNATTSPDVDARQNWWGVATGPTYTAGNPGGRGDSITDHVLYNPWLDQATGSNLSITEARAMPASLNPNGGHITFTARLSSSATWTITISDGNGNTVKTYSGSGTTIIQKWYGDDSQSIKVADGPYYYRIGAQEPASGASASSPEGLFVVSSQVPIVYMDPPVDNQMFTGGTTINITGMVSDTTDFKNYTLDYGVGGNPGSWTTLKTATTQVSEDLIFAWNTAILTGSLYTLRLTVNDNAGNTVVDTARVRLLWIQNAVVSQNNVSPNGDGKQDATTISATFSHPSVWTITLNDPFGAQIKSYNGTATALSQNWDGTNDAGAIVVDGIYPYKITAVSSEAGVQASPKTGTIIVDTTIPVALISAPVSNSVVWNTVLITGSASDMNIDTYKVEYGPAAGSGPWTMINSGTSSISNDTLATWITNDPALPVPIPNGNYLIRLTVTDKAGNTAISSVTLVLDDLQIASVGASSNSIDTSLSQSSSIFYTINSPATVTLKIIPEKQGPNGTPVYQVSQTCATVGAYSFTWNGQDNSGKSVPDEAYIYIVEATDGVKTYTYNPSAPTGTGTITCSHSTGFDPEMNIPMTITYSPAQPARVNIIVDWWGLKYTVLGAFPATPVSHAFDWDGRKPNNNLLDIDASFSSCSIASLLPENYIITTGDTVKVTDLKTDPYEQQISYGQLTRITYTLSREAYVTVTLTSLYGSSIALISNQFQVAGPQVLEWRGLDTADVTGKKTLVTEDGDYTVSVQTVNPTTGTSSTTRAHIRIGY